MISTRRVRSDFCKERPMHSLSCTVSPQVIPTNPDTRCGLSFGDMESDTKLSEDIINLGIPLHNGEMSQS